MSDLRDKISFGDASSLAAAVTGSVGAGAGIPLMGVPVPIAFAALQVRTEAVPPGPGSDLRAGF